MHTVKNDSYRDLFWKPKQEIHKYGWLNAFSSYSVAMTEQNNCPWFSQVSRASDILYISIYWL